MKFLIKTDDYNSLEQVDYDRVVYEEKEDSQKVFVSKGQKIYEYVDLVLPSGNLWAKCNIWADKEEDAGLYFQWGDTQGYTAEQVGVDKQFDINFSDYKWYGDGGFTKYNTVDNEITLGWKDDAAHVIMGGTCSMPTSNECVELFKNTDFYLITNDDREVSGSVVKENPTGSPMLTFQFEESPSTCKGIKFYKKGDHSVSLFVPSAGVAYGGRLLDVGVCDLFWASSRLSEADAAFLCEVNSDSDGGGGGVYAGGRFNGLPVRGILRGPK